MADVSVPSIVLSDHYQISFTRTTSKHSVKRQVNQTIHYRCYKRFNEDDFLNELSNSLDILFISQTDSNHNFESISQILINVLNHHAPLKSKNVKKTNSQIGLKKTSKKPNRDINHKLKNWKQYKIWQNKTNSLVCSTKTDFFSKSIAENKDNSYLWQHIKDLSGKASAPKIPEELITNEGTSNNPYTIAKKLNCFFVNISDKLKAEQTRQKDVNGFDWDTFKPYVRSIVTEHVHLQIPLMKYDDLLSSIGSLDITKATRLDGITPKIIKLLSDVIAHPLLQIINISIHTGTFPDNLKLGTILYIFKGGVKSDPTNHRPISILSVRSKIIENM